MILQNEYFVNDGLYKRKIFILKLSIYVYLQNLYSYGSWKDLQPFYNHDILGPAAKQIPDLVDAGKADSTNKKCDSYFSKFRKLCELHSFSSLPATPTSLCLYTSSLVFQRVSISDLDAVFYSINRFHIVSLRKNPCDDKLVKLCLEGSKRLLAKPVNKKLPITVDMLKKIIDRYGKKDSTLSDLRTCTLCLLGFSGFFRYSELSNI